jgi:hypothetical protein
MYRQAASAASSMDGPARLASPEPFAPRQRPSHAFSSGVAVGSQRSPRPKAVARGRLAVAVWGEPRSAKRPMCQPRPAWRTWRQKAWGGAAGQCSGMRRSPWPVVMLSAPWSTRRAWWPGMGPAACTPLLAQPARQGGVSRMQGSASMSTAVRRRSLKPRLSPPSPGARAASGGRGHRGVASSASRGGGGRGAPSPRSPPAPDVLASRGAARAASTGQPDIPALAAPVRSLSPNPARPSRPGAAAGRCVRDPARASRLAEAHARHSAWPLPRWDRAAGAVAERRPWDVPPRQPRATPEPADIVGDRLGAR